MKLADNFIYVFVFKGLKGLVLEGFSEQNETFRYIRHTDLQNYWYCQILYKKSHLWLL